jgi:hypothetical protein
MIPFLAFLIYPQDYWANLQFISKVGWILAAALVGLFWGGVQGLASGSIVGAFDVLWSTKPISTWRFIFAGFSGLVYSLFGVLFSSSGLLSPHTGSDFMSGLFFRDFARRGASWVFPCRENGFRSRLRGKFETSCSLDWSLSRRFT